MKLDKAPNGIDAVMPKMITYMAKNHEGRTLKFIRWNY